MPTPAEELAIQQGIAADPDASELDDAFFNAARPASQVLGESVVQALTGKRSPTAHKPGSVAVSVLLDQDVLDVLRSMGPNWQDRLNDLLRADIAAGRLQCLP
ncbi:MAG: BrnA antitoxin family protein [Comamonas sp.]